MMKKALSLCSWALSQSSSFQQGPDDIIMMSSGCLLTSGPDEWEGDYTLVITHWHASTSSLLPYSFSPICELLLPALPPDPLFQQLIHLYFSERRQRKEWDWRWKHIKSRAHKQLFFYSCDILNQRTFISLTLKRVGLRTCLESEEVSSRNTGTRLCVCFKKFTSFICLRHKVFCFLSQREFSVASCPSWHLIPPPTGFSDGGSCFCLGEKTHWSIIQGEGVGEGRRKKGDGGWGGRNKCSRVGIII